MHDNMYTFKTKPSVYGMEGARAAGIIHTFLCAELYETNHPLENVAAVTGETQEGYYQPLEKAELVREGGDVTILCYSRMRYVVMQAVQSLEKQGFDPEVGLLILLRATCWA